MTTYLWLARVKKKFVQHL